MMKKCCQLKFESQEINSGSIEVLVKKIKGNSTFYDISQ